MFLDNVVGLFNRADGTNGPVRGSRTGCTVVTQGHGLLTELASRAAIMEATTPTGVAPGTALSATPPLTVWNPPSSGVYLAIIKSYIGFVSGTLGAGTLVYAYIPAQTTVPAGGAELTPQCSKLGFSRGIGRVFSGATMAAVPTLLRPAFVLGAMTTTTAVAPDPALDMVDGAILVTPGTALCLQGIAAAGTSPLVLLSLVYEELPV